jgi:hypothetical protein
MLNPETITVIDPACGSGHIYAGSQVGAWELDKLDNKRISE